MGRMPHLHRWQGHTHPDVYWGNADVSEACLLDTVQRVVGYPVWLFPVLLPREMRLVLLSVDCTLVYFFVHYPNDQIILLQKCRYVEHHGLLVPIFHRVRKIWISKDSSLPQWHFVPNHPCRYNELEALTVPLCSFGILHDYAWMMGRSVSLSAP